MVLADRTCYLQLGRSVNDFYRHAYVGTSIHLFVRFLFVCLFHFMIFAGNITQGHCLHGGKKIVKKLFPTLHPRELLKYHSKI